VGLQRRQGLRVHLQGDLQRRGVDLPVGLGVQRQPLLREEELRLKLLFAAACVATVAIAYVLLDPFHPPPRGPKELIGTWSWTERPPQRYQFRDDGTGVDSYVSGEFHWKAEAGVLTIDDGRYPSRTSFRIDGNRMIWFSDGGTPMELVRVPGH
jgi:hypothetical protein